MHPKSSKTMKMFVKVHRPGARLPVRSTEGSAGYDLFADESTSLDPNERACVSTGISIRVPEGTYGRIAPRSGLAAKHGIDVLAGVVDPDYRGEVKVVLVNLGNSTVHFKRGDRIAQLVLERIETPDVVAVESIDSTERGGGGFGSTGI